MHHCGRLWSVNLGENETQHGHFYQPGIWPKIVRVSSENQKPKKQLLEQLVDLHDGLLNCKSVHFIWTSISANIFKILSTTRTQVQNHQYLKYSISDHLALKTCEESWGWWLFLCWNRLQLLRFFLLDARTFFSNLLPWLEYQKYELPNTMRDVLFRLKMVKIHDGNWWI